MAWSLASRSSGTVTFFFMASVFSCSLFAVWSVTIFCANSFTVGLVVLSSAAFAAATSVMPPSAAFSTKALSLADRLAAAVLLPTPAAPQRAGPAPGRLREAAERAPRPKAFYVSYQGVPIKSGHFSLRPTRSERVLARKVRLQ
jgi:hypothetical protein